VGRSGRKMYRYCEEEWESEKKLRGTPKTFLLGQVMKERIERLV